MVIRVGFKYKGKCLLGFEVRVKPQGDVFMFVFERGHRRMHVSYHKDGRINHNADRPNEKHIPVMWDFWGEMEPMILHETPVKDIVGRQRVAVTGWAIEDIEKTALPEFVPQPDDIVVEPTRTTPTVGFSINIISPGTPARSIGHLRVPVLARYERGTTPIIEIETVDWLAPQISAKRLVITVLMVTPSNDGAWLLDDKERFNTWQEAVAAVIKQYGEPNKYSARTDGGINLYYSRREDDPFEL
jgi:hypothetical protein